MRTAGYLRVSTENQAEEDRFGLPDQRTAVEAFARNQRLELVDWYVDDGVSGSTLERPQLQRLLNDARKSAFEMVLVAKMDRLARDLMTQLWIEKELLRFDVELVSVGEPFRGQDPANVLFRQIIGAFAQFEKARITERMSGGRKQKARCGGYAGGGAPYGYVARRGWGRLVPEWKRSETVKRLFALRRAHPRWSLQILAEALNAEGHTTTQGKRFCRMQVKRILDRRAFYRGVYRYAGIEAPGKHQAIL